MKKQYILYTVLSIVFITLIVAFILYSFPKTFLEDVTADDVASISVFCGSSGKCFTVSNTDEIEYIVGNIQHTPMKRAHISTGYDGFSFQLTFKDSNGNTIDSFMINNDTTVRDDPFFWRSDGGLCFAYLQELESNYTSNEE